MAASYHYLLPPPPPPSSSSSRPQLDKGRKRRIGSSRRSGFKRRCAVMVKQQKTRFYIFGRCISMLLCWRDHSVRD